MSNSTSVMEIVTDIIQSDDGEIAKTSIAKTNAKIKRFQERIRKHIESNYVDFMPIHSSSDCVLEESQTLQREVDYLVEKVGGETLASLHDARSALVDLHDDLVETSLGLQLSHRILRVDDLFQCVEEANAAKEYLVVLDLLSKLKTLIYSDGGKDVDRIFQLCECYDTITVKFDIQSHVLKENLRKRFEQLVQFSMKPFKHTKSVTLQVSKDVNLLQDTVMALFQARFNSIEMCDFLLENCFEPLIVKPVSIALDESNTEFLQLTISYSVKDLGENLRPSYKQVFEHIKLLLHCLDNINVCVASEQHVFGIIGERIKERVLSLLIDECLMSAIPETMGEFEESTLVEDVLLFEQTLADSFLINTEIDRALSEFAGNFESHFRNHFSTKIFESVKAIMAKDLQDMTGIADKNTSDFGDNNLFSFPQCMVSKSTHELIKLMDKMLRHSSRGLGGGAGEDTEENDSYYLKTVEVILNTYMTQMPKIHEKLLESIPQQSVLFYNNCMLLAHWVAKNVNLDLNTFPVLEKALQHTGNTYLNVQVAYQQRLVMGILKEFDISDVHTLGATPLKLIRQCLRQLDLLRNVWQNVLPDKVYNKTFCDLLNDFCADIVRRILAMEDISATVATELSELIEVILDKGPTLFKEKHEVIHIRSWLKLKHLKVILSGSLIEITDLWCGGSGILTANYSADEVRHLIRALFQNTDRRAKALAKID